MSIIWCGGEDIDFPNGNPLVIDLSGGRFRSGYARHTLYAQNSGVTGISTIFPGGGITSGWLSAQFYPYASTNGWKFLGLVKSGTGGAGLYLGFGGTSKLALFKYDGSTTWTTLQTEAGTSLPQQMRYKLDMQVISFGVSATVNCYVDQVLRCTFSGDTSLAGVSDLDCVALTTGGNSSQGFSEVIVADQDTRAMSLLTMALTAAGTTDQWTGAFGDISEITCNDATIIYTNTVGQDEQFNLTDPPALTFKPVCVRIAARATSPAGSTATKVGLGVNNGGVIDAGTLQAPGEGWATLERMMAQDPTKNADWDIADLTALQVNFRSGS